TGLVMIHKKAGDLPQYLASLQYAVDDHPFDAAKLTMLGDARRTLHQYPAALEAFNRVVGIRPASCKARLDVANVLVDMRRVDPAIVHLKACLQNDPNYYPAVVNLG